MIETYITLLILQILFLFWWGFVKRGGINQFPFFLAIPFAGFVFPQIFPLMKNSELPEGALTKTILFANMCIASGLLGYFLPTKPFRSTRPTYSYQILIIASVIYTAAGFYFLNLIYGLPKELTSVSQWTGLPVAYIFISKVNTYGFILSLLLFLNYRSKVAAVVLSISFLYLIDRIILNGRRAETVQFFSIVMGCLWFAKRYVPPRPVMVAGLVAGTLVINGIGLYRALLSNTENKSISTIDWSAVADIDFVSNFEAMLEAGGSELRNAVFWVEAVDRTLELDWGLSHWNVFIFNYVPAQIFGKDFKESLMFTERNIPEEVFGYYPEVGSTNTGLADCFFGFWYFGCFKFFIIGYIMKRLYLLAMAGSLRGQIVYLVLITESMQAVTHGTYSFMVPFGHMALFLFPVLWLASRKAIVNPS